MDGKLKENTLIKSVIFAISGLLLCYMIGFMVWTVLYTETGNGDNVEHIHSTWLINQGKIPYKDFFQHHNPLLWYVFAPLIGWTTNQLLLLDLAHSIGMIAGILMLFVVYKICINFFASKLSAILSILTLCPPYFYIYCFNYNPDTFMALFYVIGVYYLFLYWEKQRFSALSISFFSFFISFMFTQKILVVLFVLGLLSLFVFYKKKTPIGDILYSLLLPIIGLSFFLVYLYSKGALGLYWETNYLFNIEMQEYYGNYKINVADRDVLRFSLALAIISVLCFFIKSKIYFKIISILFVFEIWQRYFYFSISPYYMLPLMVYIICLNSVIIEKIISFRKEFAILFLMLASFYAIDSKEKYLKVRNYDRSFARYIANNVTPCDYVLSGFLGNQSIVSKDPHYYWALLGHIDVAGEKMGIYSKPNVSEVVLKYKPKLIYGGTYYDNYSKNRGYTIPIQKVDDKILNEYYLPTPFSNFYLLKYEYHKKNCSYDKQKKDWLYAN